MHPSEQLNKPVYGRRERFRINAGVYMIAAVPLSALLLAWRFLRPPGMEFLHVLTIGSLTGLALGVILHAATIRSLDRRLRGKCRLIVMRDTTGAPLVGVRPESDPCYYDGDRDYDLGFLLPEQGRLVFVGDRSTFQLKATDIGNLSSTSDGIEITWRDGEGRSEVLCVRTRGGWSHFLGDTALLKSLNSWLLDPDVRSWSPATWGLPPRARDLVGVSTKQPRWLGFVGALVGMAGVWSFGKDGGQLLLWALPLAVGLVGYQVHRWLGRPGPLTEASPAED